jgi:hypothetical protein
VRKRKQVPNWASSLVGNDRHREAGKVCDEEDWDSVWDGEYVSTGGGRED